jgi:hypothetical protein
VDGNNYVIVDMTLTPKEVQIGCNAGQITLDSIMGDKLTAISGDVRPYQDTGWDGGSQNIGIGGYPDFRAAAKFTLTIPNIDNIGAVVPLTVKLDKFATLSQQNTTAVANAVCSPATGLNVYTEEFPTYYLYANSTTYAATVNSAISNGYQLAHAYGSITITRTSGAFSDPIRVTLQFSSDGANWYNAATTQCSLTGTADYWNTHISVSALVYGVSSSTSLYIRVKIEAYGLSGVGYILIEDATCSFQIVYNHSHNWTQTGVATNYIKADQTDDALKLTAATPTHVYYRINHEGELGSWTDLSCPAGSNWTGVVANIKSSLITGNNIIEFINSGAAGYEKGTVHPSVTYGVYGS